MRSVFAIGAALWFVAWAVFTLDWFVFGFALLSLALVDGPEMSRVLDRVSGQGANP